MKTANLIVAAVLLACICGAANAADRRVVVFDCVMERSKGYEWAGAALGDFAAALIDAAPGFEAADTDGVSRLLRRYGYGFNQKSPFEVKDRIRENLGASAVLEGVCVASKAEFRFNGSIVDVKTGDIVSALDFKVAPFDIFKTQDKLRALLEKTLGTKIPGDRKKLIGTASKEACIDYYKGKALVEIGAYKEAAERLARAVRKDGKYVEPLIQLGRALMMATRYDAARKHLEKAVALEPANHRAWFLLGMAARLMRDVGVAERGMRKAVSLNAGDPDYRYQLALLYHENGLYNDAEREFLAAVRLDDGMVECWYGLAALYSARMERDKTLDALEKAVAAGGAKMRDRMRNDEDFRWLRSDARFKRLLSK